MFQGVTPSFHSSHYQFSISLDMVIAFHYKTWRTIVDICLHSIDKIKLYNLHATDRSPDIVLNQQLTFRIVDDHIVQSFLPCPHVKGRFDYGLSFTCARDSELGYAQSH